MSATWAFVIAAAIAFLLGLRGSVRLTQRYLGVADVLEDRRLLGVIVVVAWTVTGAAAYYGAISARRLLGFEALDWAPVLGTIIASIVLLIPAGLDAVVESIARSSGDDRRRRIVADQTAALVEDTNERLEGVETKLDDTRAKVIEVRDVVKRKDRT